MEVALLYELFLEPVSPADAERYHRLDWWRDTTGLDELLAAVRRHPDKATVVSYRSLLCK